MCNQRKYIYPILYLPAVIFPLGFAYFFSTIYVFDPSRIGQFIVGLMFLIPGIVLSVLTLIIGLIQFFRKKFSIIVVPLIIFFSLFAFTYPIASIMQRSRADRVFVHNMKSAKETAQALELFRRDHGKYPDNLKLLISDYVRRIPRLRDCHDSIWKYKLVNPNLYVLYAEKSYDEHFCDPTTIEYLYWSAKQNTLKSLSWPGGKPEIIGCYDIFYRDEGT